MRATTEHIQVEPQVLREGSKGGVKSGSKSGWQAIPCGYRPMGGPAGAGRSGWQSPQMGRAKPHRGRVAGWYSVSLPLPSLQTTFCSKNNGYCRGGGIEVRFFAIFLQLLLACPPCVQPPKLAAEFSRLCRFALPICWVSEFCRFVLPPCWAFNQSYSPGSALVSLPHPLAPPK